MLSIGLMSGTSLDGVDAALIETNGVDQAVPLAFLGVPYETEFRERLRACLGARADVTEVERDLTRYHADAVSRLLAVAGVAAADVGVVGFHGQTILHAPEQRRTVQIGDGSLLARSVGIPVVTEFRIADVAAGGQGAPFAPLFHDALAGDLERPAAILNVGGVANVTWLGRDGRIIACDTGPGNAMIDDWVLRSTGRPYDEDGRLAAAGRIHDDVLRVLLDNPFFGLPAPKSLDRDAFDADPVVGLSVADGAATLTAFTAAAVAKAVDILPEPPLRWFVTGGGRRNATLMRLLGDTLARPVEPVEAIGWDGDALEAQAFAYLAVRSIVGLPLSLPTTTGVPQPMPGGRLHPVEG